MPQIPENDDAEIHRKLSWVTNVESQNMFWNALKLANDQAKAITYRAPNSVWGERIQSPKFNVEAIQREHWIWCEVVPRQWWMHTKGLGSRKLSFGHLDEMKDFPSSTHTSRCWIPSHWASTERACQSTFPGLQNVQVGRSACGSWGTRALHWKLWPQRIWSWHLCHFRNWCTQLSDLWLVCFSACQLTWTGMDVKGRTSAMGAMGICRPRYQIRLCHFVPTCTQTDWNLFLQCCGAACM